MIIETILKNKKILLLTGLLLLLFLIVSASSVCAANLDNTTSDNNTFLGGVNLTNKCNNTITNNIVVPVNLSTVSCDVDPLNSCLGSYNKVDSSILINYNYYKSKISDKYLKANTTSLADLKFDYDNLNNILDLNYSNACNSIVNNLTYLRNKVYHAFQSKIEAKDNLTEDENKLERSIFRNWLLRNNLPYKAEQLYNHYYKYYSDKIIHKEDSLNKMVKRRFKNKSISSVMSDLLNNKILTTNNSNSSNSNKYDLLNDLLTKVFNAKDAEIKRLKDNNNKLHAQINELMIHGLKNATLPDNHTKTLNLLLGELNRLVGLDNVKKSINASISVLKMNNIRAAAGLKKLPISLHLVFTGNPGTGKTTVARLISQIYKELGVLSKGQLIEKDRSGLIGEFTGQTPPKVMKAVNDAMGGVLFIDEAYNIVAGEKDGYGKEAVATLLKAMEDKKNDFVVIVAGYPDEMEKFIKSNPGFKSRFTQFIHFDDYSPKEMLAIFKKLCDDFSFTLEPDAEKLVEDYLMKICIKKSKSFANARDVRNIFDHITTNLSIRLSSMSNINNKVLTTITAGDIIVN